jgi:peptide deformylase
MSRSIYNPKDRLRGSSRDQFTVEAGLAGGRLYRGARPPHIWGMAVLEIVRMGHPVLRAVARRVDDPTAAWVRRLADDMIETMETAGGTGLAAPQVNEPWRIVVFRVDADRLSERALDFAADLTVLVNPTVELIGGERAFGWEGCLSVPALRGVVPRHLSIRYRGTGLDGGTIERAVEGFHARVVQHECDHLDGILYPQRMTDLRLLVFLEELQLHPIDLAALLAERPR